MFKYKCQWMRLFADLLWQVLLMSKPGLPVARTLIFFFFLLYGERNVHFLDVLISRSTVWIPNLWYFHHIFSITFDRICLRKWHFKCNSSTRFLITMNVTGTYLGNRHLRHYQALLSFSKYCFAMWTVKYSLFSSNVKTHLMHLM